MCPQNTRLTRMNDKNDHTWRQDEVTPVTTGIVGSQREAGEAGWKKWHYQPTLEDLAADLVNKLFTNGFGEQAHRLVLTTSDGRDLGGWGRRPVYDRILEVLRAVNKTETS